MPQGQYKQFRWMQAVPVDWIDAIDKEAKKAKMTRNEWARQAFLGNVYIPERVARKLSEPQRAGRPVGG